MTANEIKDYIYNLVSHITFDYKGKQCGVDPLSHTDFDMWCGDTSVKVRSIDDVMNILLFDGKSLNEIANEIIVD